MPTADLEPYPGPHPVAPAPRPGSRIAFEVAGLPPIKDLHFSIRNPRHALHDRFQDLRGAAARAMAGRRWYMGPVGLHLRLVGGPIERPVLDYVAGVMDSLDGSHGPAFTYLPVLYNDDCQVCSLAVEHVAGQPTHYLLTVEFLDGAAPAQGAMKDRAGDEG